jgi:hypothetical protein
MQPSEVRRRILADHETLRGMLLSLEKSARAVVAGERRLVGPLRLEGEALLAQLADHIRWEDLHLRRALLETDIWGEERAEQLEMDHREQRELLRYALEQVHDLRRPAVITARSLLDLVKLLRAEMEQEEMLLRDVRGLRDDAVGTDVEAS